MAVFNQILGVTLEPLFHCCHKMLFSAVAVHFVTMDCRRGFLSTVSWSLLKPHPLSLHAVPIISPCNCPFFASFSHKVLVSFEAPTTPHDHLKP